MSEEMNVSGQDTVIENGEISAENGETEGTAEQGTNTENENADEGLVDNKETIETNESDGSQVVEEAEEGSQQESASGNDEVFLTADDGNQIMRSQAENYAKLGYEFQTVHQPTMEKFARIAANSKKEDGEVYSSIDELADKMLEAIDENLRQKCLNDAHGDAVVAEELFNTRKATRDKNYAELQEKRAKEKKDAIANKTNQIASDFERLQKKFPEFKTYSELPKEVKTYAAKNNVSLLEAKLTLDHDNRLAAEKAKADAQSAAEKSTGTQSGEGGNQEPSWYKDVERAFKK